MARTKKQGRMKKQKKRESNMGQEADSAGATGSAAGSGNSNWAQDRDGQQDDRRQNYAPIVMENAKFETFYKAQNIVPPEEWDAFMETLRQPLPVTFRVTGFKSQAESLIDIIKSTYFSELADVEIDGVRQEPPECLTWYPNGLAWQVNSPRQAIRKFPALKKLHEFLITETECGNISRQEAVSMIPPLFMDIKPHHMILDMCAAPGSKTAQLIEYLHQDENINIPDGFVIANDTDNKRCYLMVHQVKRLQSPCFLIVNHDATQLPNFRSGPEYDAPPVRFDRILADVPCSGDGTLRKNKDVWLKWRPSNGAQLHKLQLLLLKRGLEMLKEGGRLVYSTCSLNPYEDEAVIASTLASCEGSVELVDVSTTVPGLKTCPGLSSWIVSENNGEIFHDYASVPRFIKKCFLKTLFPPENAASMHLERCMRVLPHHQNTGGFFIAVLTKTKNLPWQKPSTQQEPTKLVIKPQCGKGANVDAGLSSTDTVDVKPLTAAAGDGLVDSSEVKVEATVDNAGDNGTEIKPSSTATAEVKVEASVDGSGDNSTEKPTSTATAEVKVEASVDGNGANGTDTPASTAAVDGEVDSSQVKAEGSEDGAGANKTNCQPGQKRKWEHDNPRRAKKKGGFGHREDPFLWFKEDEPLWPAVKEYYGVSDDFPMTQCLVRCETGKKRQIYFVSEPIKALHYYNQEKIKFVNMGISLLVRSDNPAVRCDYRLTQDAIHTFSPFISKRSSKITMTNIVTLLSEDAPFFFKFTDDFAKEVEDYSQGSILLTYEPDGTPGAPKCGLSFIAWRGKTSLRSFIPRAERAHYLRLCGIEQKENAKEEKESTENAGEPTATTMTEELPSSENVPEPMEEDKSD